MKIALLGGTGSLGTGLAARWAGFHEILLGSRSYDRASSACDKVRSMIPDAKARSNVSPRENYHAIEESEIVVLCIGYEQAMGVIRQLIGGFRKQLVISPLSPMMQSADRFAYIRPKEGSAAAQLAGLLPSGVDVVSAFQSIPASKLLDVNRALNFDVPVFADSASARKKVFDLIRDIRYLKPLWGGDLDLAYLGEMMAPLRRNVAALNKLKDPSYKFVE